MVLVEHILDTARGRLAILSVEASAAQAAHLLADPSIPLILVCNDAGTAVGVISRTDILKAIACGGIEVATSTASAIMTESIFSCRREHALQSVWQVMNSRSIRSTPVLDADGRPLGVVHARDVALALLDEVGHEEELLRDYVLGIGYQ